MITGGHPPTDPDWDKKLQDENQVKGRYGELLAAFAFPPHWVVRPILDDYGLDLELEVFYEVSARAKNGVRRYETRGEHLYLQVKTTDNLETQMLRRKDSSDLPVATFQMSTTDLKLVDRMGASVPVVLLLVDRTENKIYYICLTDYVSHYLDIGKTNWREQKSVKLYVPKRNQLTTSGNEDELFEHWNYFSRLARRSKLYSAFNLIHHYMEELRYVFPQSGLDGPEPSEEYFESAVAFVAKFSKNVEEIRRQDIWPAPEDQDWAILHTASADLEKIGRWCQDMDQKLTMRPQVDEVLRTELADLFDRKADWELRRLGTVDLLGREYQALGRMERLPGTDPFLDFAT